MSNNQAPTQSKHPLRFWASINNSDGSVRFLFRHHTTCQQVFHPLEKRWVPYSGDSLWDVFEGRFPMLTEEQAVELFPHIAERLNEG